MIKQINIEDIPGRLKQNYALEDVEEFIRAGMDCCEVVIHERTATESAYSSYSNAVNKLNCRVKVMRRKNRIFLVKEDLTQ